MSISSRKIVVSLVAAAVAVASAGAFAQDRYDDRPYEQGPHDGRYDNGDEPFDYARVVDVQPLVTRVRVSTPQRECWDETRVDNHGYGNSPLPRTQAGGAVLGGIVGAVLGHQIGHGQGRDAATAVGAVVGAAIGSQQAQRRAAYASAPPQSYTVQRCETRYHDEWQERTDGYRVTYVYNGRRQVTEMPYRPGDRIRVRVDVSPGGVVTELFVIAVWAAFYFERAAHTFRLAPVMKKIRQGLVPIVLLAVSFAPFAQAHGMSGQVEGGSAEAQPVVTAVRRDGISLDEAVKRAEAQYRAKVVRTDVQDEDGRKVYVLKLLSEDGRVITVRIDAATGRSR